MISRKKIGSRNIIPLYLVKEILADEVILDF